MALSTISRALRVFLALGLVVAIAALAIGRDASSKTLFVVRTDDDRVSVHVVMPIDGADPMAVHYAEHLTWLNAVGPEQAIDRHSNAWTSNRAVGYWLSGAPEDLPSLLTTLAGVFDPIALPSDFAEDERDIVLREYEHRMIDNPNAQAREAMNAFLYAKNAAAASVIGTPQEILALGYDETRALHAKIHRPERASVVVVGDVSEREVRRAMRKAGWPETEGAPPEVAPPPFELAEAEVAALRYPDPDAAPRLIWRRVTALPEPVPFDVLEAQLALLRAALDTALPGGIAGPLRFDAAIARSFALQLWPIDEDTVEMRFIAAPDEGVSLARLQSAFETTLAESAAAGIPEASFSRVLSRFEDFWPDWDDKDETADWMSDYVQRRTAALRRPLSERELRDLHAELSLAATDALLRQITTKGRSRQATAFIGPEEHFE